MHNIALKLEQSQVTQAESITSLKCVFMTSAVQPVGSGLQIFSC
jgi:hypothetical protein